MFFGISVLDSVWICFTSALLCLLLYTLAGPLSVLLSRSYVDLSFHEKVYWRMNVVAWMHAFFGSIFAVYTMVRYPEIAKDLVNGNQVAPYVEIGASMSFGYFVYDMGIVLHYYSELPQSMLKVGQVFISNLHLIVHFLLQLPTIIHHSFILTGVLFVWIYETGIVIVVLALVEDVSTVLLYTRFFMRKMGVTPNSFWFRLNETLLFVTFPLFRFLHNFYLLRLIWISSKEFCEISVLLWFWGVSVFSVVGLLNTLWLFRLFSSVELFRGSEEDKKIEEMNLLALPSTIHDQQTLEYQISAPNVGNSASESPKNLEDCGTNMQAIVEIKNNEEEPDPTKQKSM